MQQKKALNNHDAGFVLVLAVFMLSLLAMIGLAAMTTSTTEIEIAANEKFRKIAFYQAESGLNIGAELVEMLDGQYEAEPVYGDEDTLITVKDVFFLYEDADTVGQGGPGNRVRLREDQTIDSGPLLPSSRAADTRYDIVVSGKHKAFIDIDKLGSRELPGGGAEFASGAEGRGVSSRSIIYEIDSIGRLPAGGKARANNLMGFELIPKY
jgi:hypothetical protein